MKQYLVLSRGVFSLVVGFFHKFHETMNEAKLFCPIDVSPKVSCMYTWRMLSSVRSSKIESLLVAILFVDESLCVYLSLLCL